MQKVGPGAYEIGSLIGSEGMKLTISPKIKDKHRERESRNIPGPGAYDVLATTSTLMS